MKQNIAKVFTFSLLASSISFISCVDNEKNLFDADQLKQIYEETFPVKNIDLDGDWTVSRSVIACVSVNGDQGVDYKIQIFDADPLSPGSTAKLLAEGTVNQSTTLNVVMDCATALDKVFVARIDEHKRYLVQPVAIENGTVTAHLGDAHYIWIYRSTTSHVEYRQISILKPSETCPQIPTVFNFSSRHFFITNKLCCIRSLHNRYISRHSS